MLKSITQPIDFINTQGTLSKDEMNNLGPGCYVKVNDDDQCYWAEIKEVHDEIIVGVVHKELGDESCEITKGNPVYATFRRSQITDLGCDNYCWC